MTIKITLDVPALEKIMHGEGGEQFVLEVKQAALNTAASHFIKAVTPEMVLQASKPLIEKLVKEILGENMQRICDYNLVTLAPHVESALKAQVEEFAKVMVSKAIDSQKLNDYINGRVEEYAKQVKPLIDSAVKDRVNSAIIKLAGESIAERLKTKVEATNAR